MHKPGELAISTWWKGLSEQEKNVLIAVLYNLDLQDYVMITDDGIYQSLKEE